MIVPGSANPLLMASLAGYQIPYSLRFRASNTAYIRRIIGASSTSTTIATWSFWIKRGAFGAGRQLIVYNGNVAGSGNTIQLEFTSGSAILAYFNGAGSTGFTTNALFRDPSAWYHVVLAYDSTQTTDSNRSKLYVNGTQITSFASVTYPALNQAFNAGSGDYQQMMGLGATLNTDGYMAEVNFIDGQALTPSSFGQTDSATGVWVPKKYSGTYGTNGFYLKFADAASTTTIGNDSSGNANNWTTSGISVTSGTTFDQMLDTPTLNYCTLSPIYTDGSGAISAANLNFNGLGSNYNISSTIGVSSGKWYWEYTGAAGQLVGVFLQGGLISSTTGALSYFSDGNKYTGSTPSAYGASWTGSDIIGVALDLDGGTLTFYKNNVSQGTAFSSLSGTYFPWVRTSTSATGSLNFGQRAFSYTPPTGFKALNTQNIASAAVTTSGSFTGNAAADGPFIWANGNPATLTINGNAVTFGTHADKTAGGFKLRTSSASYNTSGTNNWTATAGKRFVQSKKPNNAQVNP